MRRISRRGFMQVSGLAALSLGLAGAVQWSGARVARAAAGQNPMLHVLNRVTWGVRPEDAARCERMGIEAYVDWQLQPEAIADPAVDDLLLKYPVLSMKWGELRAVAIEDYEQVLLPMLWSRIYRAVYSEHQLYENLVEFWTDHFNIPIADLLVEKVIDDREVIRTHALGRFRDLLLASAQSPAMLSYLDNAVSEKEHPNENYAREVMELHTLGVDGGYTEQDVKEVARALTGWTVREGWPGGFFFDATMHDTGEKVVLGRRLAAGRGIEDGLEVLDLLASHASTAHFISFKLCRRFVSDNPPESLVRTAAQIFSATDGDIRQVMRIILLSPEFMESAGLKFRRPLDYLVAMLRVARPALTIEDPSTVIWPLDPMGHLPFFWHPPNGYPDVAGAWMNTNGLLTRWNTAMLLPYASQDWFEGINLNMDALVPQRDTVGELVDFVCTMVLGGIPEPSDREQLIAFVSEDADPNQPATGDLRWDRLPALLGLVMASPYFQWH